MHLHGTQSTNLNSTTDNLDGIVLEIWPHFAYCYAFGIRVSVHGNLLNIGET